MQIQDLWHRLATNTLKESDFPEAAFCVQVAVGVLAEIADGTNPSPQDTCRRFLNSDVGELPADNPDIVVLKN